MLFQPSNITPDEINGSGCFDATQGMSVSWQVNGDSAMTAYQIVILENTAASTQLYTTGKVTLGTPFWGVNYKGQTQFFTATISAADLSAAGITNGNEYKMLITQWWSANDSITQTTASLFLTRSTPSVSIAAIPDPLTEREYSFTGSYAQAQGDALKWVRWQLAVTGSESSPFLDTGEIGGTGELQVDYDGFFTGTSYSVKLSVETENGIAADTGWVTFSVEYEVTEPQGSVTACQLQDSSAVFVQWTQQEAAQGYDVYRRTVGEDVLTKIASVDDTTGQLRDYGVQSGSSYVYYVYPTGVLAYLTEPMVSEPISVAYWFWTIIEAAQNADGSYSVEALHFFRYGSGGVQEGTFSNNNAPQIQKNFTQYPTRQADSANYLSGSVSGYIGTISNDGGMQYIDTLQQAAAFRALSTTENALFLLDPKGHFIRIATSGEVTMTINHKSPARPSTVTVPWVETDSTDDVALFAAPSGTFYPVDQIIFTTVRVDPESGILYWDRPADYSNGSTLKLVTESSYIVKSTDTASGEIASFETDVGDYPLQALSFPLAPIQDLHGYDSPWPAGGGKNRLRLTINGTIEDNNGITATVNPDGSVTLNGTTTAENTFFNLNYVNGSTLSIEKNVPLIINGSSGPVYVGVYVPGSIASSNNGADAAFTIPDSATVSWCRVGIWESGVTVNNLTVYPMIRSASETDPTFAPYENICPISGRTVADVTRCGKNLANFIDGKGVSVQGEVVDAATRTATVDAIPIDSNKQYVLSYNENTVFRALYCVYNGDTLVRRVTNVRSGTVLNTADGDSLRVALYPDSGTSSATVANNAPQLELGSSASAYEPYSGVTVSLNWQTEAGTVYGGNATYLGGGNWRLTVTHGGVDMGDLSWAYSSGYFQTGELNGIIKRPPTITSIPNVLCSMFKASYWNDSSDDTVIIRPAIQTSAGRDVWIRDDSYSDSASFTTAVTGQQLVYELETPLTYTLTTAELTSLLGTNNVWCDADSEVSVTYVTELEIAEAEGLTQVTEGSFTPATLAIVGNLLTATTGE